ncbi:galactokinase [Carnobacterium mobile]|uniref:galactokinase n=1 Tax=Carnobacterium mobile TaxID=2750 RepID=UPI000553D498|nr:galactokinase [Carnobacterium mobile]
MELNELKEKFVELFGHKELKAFFAPGRINLIGEHTDYNGGNVFPCAITLGTLGVAARREDTQINLYSENFSELGVISFDLEDLAYRDEDKWTNYPKGMIKYLKEAGYPISSGMDVALYGNIPNGAGLSSSASLELLMGVMLEDLFDLPVSRLDLIQTGKRVENEFIGVNSGIMDQFAVGMGKKDTAILLDCNTLEYELVPVELGAHKIVIMNTKKRRELATSNYNSRRNECEQALEELQKFIAAPSLGALDEAEFETYQDQLSNQIIKKRARHAVTENQRTIKAAKALKEGDLKQFGSLMNASHVSLRDDYEVTGVELDTLVQAAWDQPGVIGARMTGAGFGGCAIAIVADDQIDSFIQQVGKTYETEIGYPAEFYIASIGDGAKAVKEA